MTASSYYSQTNSGFETSEVGTDSTFIGQNSQTECVLCAGDTGTKG